jgi:L-alanine-DL-glutamate epimerase-like enolase superfamily enzyme
VRAARQGVGDGIDIMVDAHGTFSVAEAKRFCREVADCRLRWFEEPVTADDKRGCAEIRAGTDIPISAGESEFTRFDFRDLAELRAVDIFQPDMAICGGITEGMRIAALASAGPPDRAGAAPVGRRADVRRRVAPVRRLPQRRHGRVFPRPQPHAA